MTVSLLSYTANPERLIAASAKLCYSPSTIETLLDGLSDEKSADFVEMLSDMGHESPIEHVSFTFAIEGVSRALLAQITRHRIASYSVQSQRYVAENSFEYVVPPEIEAVPEAKAEFLKAMVQAQEHYQKLTEILQERHRDAMILDGISPDEAGRKAQKKAIEDARFVLPNACDTKMIVTMNARSLRNFFRLRCCSRAQWEIRDVANEMLRLVYEKAPTLFKTAGPGCVAGNCPEGKMTCGNMESVRRFYREMKGGRQ